MWSTACSQACLFAFENDLRPLSLRTYCSAEARTSSSVAGGSKWYRVLMFRHMTGVCLKIRRGHVLGFVSISPVVVQVKHSGRKAMPELHRRPHDRDRRGAARLPQADCFDIVAVRIEQEGGVVGRPVVGAQTRRSVVAAAGFAASRVETIHRSPIGGPQGHMDCAIRAAFGGIQPKGPFIREAESSRPFLAGAEHETQR